MRRFVGIFALILAACQTGGSSDGPAASSASGSAAKTASTSGTGAPTGPAKAAGPQTLPKVALQADIPSGDVIVSEAFTGEAADIAFAVLGATMQVAVASPDAPKTMAEGKQRSEMMSGKNTKAEQLKDGWVVTWEEAMGDKTGYSLLGRREIGGKAYECRGSMESADFLAKAVALCKSLRK
jgi:hypothetical protein